MIGLLPPGGTHDGTHSRGFFEVNRNPFIMRVISKIRHNEDNI